MYTHFLDKLVIFGLIALASIPFAQIFILNLGLVKFDLSEVLQLYLLIVFLVIISVRGIVARFLPYVFFVCFVFAIYLWCSLVFVETTIDLIIGQLRNFLPFFVACIALLTRLQINVNTLLRMIIYTLAFSAFLAISIHLFFQNLITYAFSENEELQSLASVEGRMIWGNSPLAFFAVAALLLTKENRAYVLFGFSVIIIGLIFTQNRTLPAGLFLFYFLSNTFIFKKKLVSIIKIILLSIIAISLFYLIVPSEMLGLLLRRLFLTADPESEYIKAFETGRIPLYIQYLNSIQNNFPIGQGIGIPLSVRPTTETPIFKSDISFISFLLPFGLFGFAIFVGFIFIIFKNFRNYSRIYSNDKSAPVFILLLGSAILVSLNIDLFSRNIFVLYLTVFSVIFNFSLKITENSLSKSQKQTA